MNKKVNIHDRTFKHLVKDKRFAQNLLKQYLTEEEQQLFNVDSIELWNASYVGYAGEYNSDVVYKADTTQGEGYFIFLFEHQSKPEKLMPFRILEYSIFLMRQHLKQGNKKLPIIIPDTLQN